MNLWNDWGISDGTAAGVVSEAGDGKDEVGGRRKEKEDRWRRCWILCESRKAVRRWVEERDKAEA